MLVKEIEIKKIRSLENSRGNHTHIPELMKSIKTQGLMQPLVVCKKGAGYELVSGNRRLDACTKLRMKTVPCSIIHITDKKDFVVKNTVENMQREDVPAFEQGRMFYELKEKYKMSIGEIAASCSMHTGTVSSLMTVFKQTPLKHRQDVKLKTHRGAKRGVSVSTAKTIANSIVELNLGPKKKAHLWDEAIKNKLNQKQVEHMAQQLHRTTRLIKGESVQNIKTVKVMITLSESEKLRLERKYKLGLHEVGRMILSGHIKNETIKQV